MDNSDVILLVYDKGQNTQSISYGLLGCLLRLEHMSPRFMASTVCKMQLPNPAFESMVWLLYFVLILAAAHFVRKKER